MMRVFLAAFVLLFALDSVAPAAFIESWNGPDSAYAIESHGTRSVPQSFGAPLFEGDCVLFVGHQPGIRLVVNLPGRRDEVSAENPRVCAHNPPIRNAMLVAIWQTLLSVSGIFRRAQEDEHLSGAVSRGSENGALWIPLLSSAGCKIAPGRRRLALAWRNGRAPFSVRLYAAGTNSPVVEQRSIAGRTTQLPAAEFSAGTYSVVIRDGTSSEARGTFSVVSAASVPLPPGSQAQAIADPSLAPDLRAGVYAAWLYQTDRAWRLEAYQQIAPFAQSSQTARLLAFELTGGD